VSLSNAALPSAALAGLAPRVPSYAARQGRRGVFYASNYAPAGNGHDLSCVSGLVSPVPVQSVARACPVLVRMSRGPGADVAGVSPVLVQMLQGRA
jgi:hypothetical protein